MWDRSGSYSRLRPCSSSAFLWIWFGKRLPSSGNKCDTGQWIKFAHRGAWPARGVSSSPAIFWWQRDDKVWSSLHQNLLGRDIDDRLIAIQVFSVSVMIVNLFDHINHCIWQLSNIKCCQMPGSAGGAALLRAWCDWENKKIFEKFIHFLSVPGMRKNWIQRQSPRSGTPYRHSFIHHSHRFCLESAASDSSIFEDIVTDLMQLRPLTECQGFKLPTIDKVFKLHDC